MSTRRERLLAAAARQFTQFGFRKTNIEDITRAAGISKGAFYLEFSTKEILFDQLVRHEFCAYLTDAAARVDADPDGGRLSRIYQHSVRALLQREFLQSLYTDADGMLTGILQEHGAQRYRPRVLLGAEFVERLQRAALIRPDVPAESLSHVLSTLMVGPLLSEPLLRAEDSPPLAETLSTISGMITATFETADGDVAAGKRAFGDLVESVTRSISRTDPDEPDGAPGDEGGVGSP